MCRWAGVWLAVGWERGVLGKGLVYGGFQGGGRNGAGVWGYRRVERLYTICCEVSKC